jgi:hypothetical protein
VNQFKTSILLISLSVALAACGGGGSSDNTGSGTGSTGGSGTGSTGGSGTGSTGGSGTGGTNTDSSTGSVLEKLSTNKTYRTIYDFPNSSGSSQIDSVVQNDTGIITELGDYKITGDIIAKEIAGNKNYAIARISKGIFNYDNNGEIKTTDISKYTNGSYFYFVYTPLVAKRISPQTKQISCTDVNVTQAKLTNGGSLSSYISPSVHNGSITLNPNGDIDVKFTAKSGSDETTFTSTMRWVDSFNSYNGYNMLSIVGQQGQSDKIGTFNISDNGTNSLVLGAIYRMPLSNGGNYQGAVSMVCNY